MHRDFFPKMAFDKWTLLSTALVLLVSSIGNMDAQSCGGNYTTNYGVFTSPNYPDVYPLNVECVYRITPSTIMSSITLNFETFELDRSKGDYVSITCEGDAGYVPKNFTWDDKFAPISLSRCRIGRLYFKSDSNHSYSTRGFRVQYQVNTEGCGNTVFEASSGTISSPNYPINYNNNENCTYSIWAEETSSFNLSFEAFHLETNCLRDWVQIRCDNSSYILPKYCGSALPNPVYISDCKKVLIWFHTDYSNVFSGFSLQYSLTLDGCGQKNYDGLSGIITSPNYPIGQNSMYCAHYLHPVSSVALAFQSFDLEPFIDSVYGDYIQIECDTHTSHNYERYQGNTLPPLIFCSSCYLVSIYFKTNNALSGTGFSLKYQVNPLVALSTIATSPKNVTVDVGNRVQLDCTSDAINYYPSWTLSKDGTEENTTVIASYCRHVFGDRSKYSVVKGGPGVCNLVIKSATLAEAGIYKCIDVGLSSSSSVVTVMGSTATSTSVPTTTSAPSGQVGCGGSYTTNYGIIMSPNYPEVYPLNVECVYKITPPTMSSIALHFETFELDRSAGDYVSVTCESDPGYVPKNLTWDDNMYPISIPSCIIARIYFHSDSSHSYSTRGFRIQYQVDTEGCGSTAFRSSPGTISSPNYPQNYNNNENCTYSIWAQEISSFTLSFEAFNLEPDCQRDWVQIRCDNSSYILPKYCGSTLPKQAYITNCNKVLIWFHTDNSTVFSGFSLQYSITENGCGKKVYSGLSGIMTSPNYPKGNKGMFCYYYLYPVSSVALAFQEFDLEPFVDDTYGAYLQIGCSSNSGETSTYYHGNSLPPLIILPLCYSIYFNFHTNDAMAGNGFNVRYQVNPLVPHSAITTAPKNFTVDVGSRVQLDCTSDATDYYPSWTLRIDETHEDTIAIASLCFLNYDYYYTAQYAVVKGGPGVCNLVITNATLAEAGIYTCIDVGLASATSVVTVVALHDDNQK